MSLNLIMVEHAASDPRSVSAMLHGNGDGREQSWQSFADAHPALSQEQLMDKFRLEARYGRIKLKTKPSISHSKQLLVLLIALAVIT